MERSKAQFKDYGWDREDIANRCIYALKRDGKPELAKELYGRVKAASSFDEALRICLEYVEAI